jgi:hypothetical protein
VLSTEVGCAEKSIKNEFQKLFKIQPVGGSFKLAFYPFFHLFVKRLRFFIVFVNAKDVLL